MKRLWRCLLSCCVRVGISCLWYCLLEESWNVAKFLGSHYAVYRGLRHLERRSECTDVYYVILGGKSEWLRISTLVEQHADSACANKTNRNLCCFRNTAKNVLISWQYTRCKMANVTPMFVCCERWARVQVRLDFSSRCQGCFIASRL
jgi:hypothetical protein